MGEGTDRPVGERRRRREAERAAEVSSTPQPLTRRELRRRQAEEAARLEAIATGELPADELAERMRTRAASATADSAPSAASAPSARPAAPGPAAPPGAPGSAERPAAPGSAARPSATSTPAASSTGRPARPAPAAPASPPAGSTHGSAPSSTTAATAGSAPSSAATPPVRPASAGRSTATAGSAPSAVSASTAPSGPRLPSRRSLRELAEEADASAGTSERPQERTATGRRPVVRTPSTAQGVRALDSTGRLTGIQPVVRPDTPPRGQELPAPLTDWNQNFSIELDVPARTARDAMPVEQAPRTPREEQAPRVEDERPAAAETADHVDEDDVEYPLRPKWVAIDQISANSAEDAPSEPLRRTRRDRPEDEPGPTPQRDNPAVTIVKIAVLALVALVIGVLIWLLATEAFAGGTTPADAATTFITTPTTPHLEETRAR